MSKEELVEETKKHPIEERLNDAIKVYEESLNTFAEDTSKGNHVTRKVLREQQGSLIALVHEIKKELVKLADKPEKK